MSQGFASQVSLSGYPAGYRFGGTVYFTTSGTFDKASYPGLKAVRVKVQAGGGGGGGATNNTGDAAAGAGGGGGGYAEAFILAENLSTSETVTVGAGGSAGANTGGSGGDGGSSSFGSHAATTAGTGGNGSGSRSGWTFLHEGSPGGGLYGDFLVWGNAGRKGIVIANEGGVARVGGLGVGGNSILGQGGDDFTNSATASAGPTGRGYGGGGAGAYRNNSSGTAAGGAGAGGIVIVEVFY